MHGGVCDSNLGYTNAYHGVLVRSVRTWMGGPPYREWLSIANFFGPHIYGGPTEKGMGVTMAWSTPWTGHGQCNTG